MELIDKNALVAEIERRLSLISQNTNAYEEGRKRTYMAVLYLIDTLEVKEVDIEDSVKETLAQKYTDYTFKRHNIDPESKEGQLIYYAYMHGINQCLTQLRAQKEE